MSSSPADREIPTAGLSVSTGEFLSTRTFLVVSLLLVAAAYFKVIRTTFYINWISEDMSQGLLAPFAAAFVAWDLRGRLQQRVSGSGWLAVPLVLLATMGGLASTLGNSTTVGRLALLLTLAAIVFAAYGLKGLGVLAFPLILLLFAQPIPVTLYGQITLPLQLLASRIAEFMLSALGHSVYREGNILYVSTLQLSVAEACSGLRSLMSLLFVGMLYAYFFEPRRGVAAALVVGVVPAAIFFNGLRVAASAVLGLNDARYLHGPLHDSLGYIASVLAIITMLVFHRLLVRKREKA